MYNNSRWLRRASTGPSRVSYSYGLTTWTRLLGVFHEQQLVLCSSTIACLSPIKQQVWSINGSHQNFNRFSLIWNNKEFPWPVRLAKYCYGDEFKKNERGGLWRVEWRGVGRTGVWWGQPNAVRPFGRPRRRWENNIKIDVKEVDWGVLDWIIVVQNKDRCRAVHNIDVECQVTWNAVIFLISWENTRFSRTLLLLFNEWVSLFVSCLVNIQIITSNTTYNWRIESAAICWEFLYCIHVRKEEIFCVQL